ncbi:adenosine deaminase 2-like [Penaeus indicus]|uniref:adenosine deaminase 2-like n=1 Tax=Penaeus indicus TaxID=29960 RepID=UPI00300D53AE
MSVAWRTVAWLAVAATACGALPLNVSDFITARQSTLEQDLDAMLGHDLLLSDAEELLNQHLMEVKQAELNRSYATLDFPPARNFIAVKDQIEASGVFKILEDMPKGAALHLHDVLLTSVKWVVQEISYWPDLYMCQDSEGHLFMKFMETPDSSCAWQLVSELRAGYKNPKDFDWELHANLSLITENPDELYPDINTVWTAFERGLIGISGMVMYRPAWESYLYRALEEFADDSVLYLEFRGVLPPIYELNGTELSPIQAVGIYRDTTQRFVADHPNTFFGARYIYAPNRRQSEDTVWGYVDLMKQLKAEYPDFVAGFDLVGQEDLGYPLNNFLEPLLSLSSGNTSIPVFYHAGETAWMGMSTDENLIDALLLNASRIGHGYAITKHPRAKALAKEKDVPIEVCPISNQVLKLVDDLRNHPAAGLMAEGFPVVVSCDGLSAWGAKGLSHDFYEAFMALGGAKADLRFLKQLALNSIKYSSLDANATSQLRDMWQEKWDDWVMSFDLSPRLTLSSSSTLATPTSAAVPTAPTATAEVEGNII